MFAIILGFRMNKELIKYSWLRSNKEPSEDSLNKLVYDWKLIKLHFIYVSESPKNFYLYIKII